MASAHWDFLVAKYQYNIRFSRATTPESIEAFKGELLRLFQSTDAPEVNGHDVTITTPMEPPEAKVVLDRLSVTHGVGWFSSGTRELQLKE
jgi:hypothetical protein